MAQKIDPSLIEVARFSHHDRPELLLSVTNEHGIHRENLHIPVGVYTGKTDIEDATYKGASDGIYVVLKMVMMKTTSIFIRCHNLMQP
ncbi:MAG: hypothetical protein ACL7BU_06325 [Candidatus Phlomobacter fragariae]